MIATDPGGDQTSAGLQVGAMQVAHISRPGGPHVGGSMQSRGVGRRACLGMQTTSQ